MLCLQFAFFIKSWQGGLAPKDLETWALFQVVQIADPDINIHHGYSPVKELTNFRYRFTGDPNWPFRWFFGPLFQLLFETLLSTCRRGSGKRCSWNMCITFLWGLELLVFLLSNAIKRATGTILFFQPVNGRSAIFHRKIPTGQLWTTWASPISSRVRLKFPKYSVFFMSLPAAAETKLGRCLVVVCVVLVT